MRKTAADTIPSDLMFSNQDLKKMIVPLFFEQLLVLLGIAVAMCMNWIVSAVAYMVRLKSGKWKQFKII